jgi:site-specific DNA-cytosine methylase/predicted GNAT family acetyltransferase
MAPAPVQAPTRAPSRMAPAPIGQRSEDPYTSEAMANVFEWLRSGDPRGAFEPPVPAPSLASRAVEFLPERFREPVRSAGRAFEESPAGSALRMVASRDPSELMADVAGGPLVRGAKVAKSVSNNPRVANLFAGGDTMGAGLGRDARTVYAAEIDPRNVTQLNRATGGSFEPIDILRLDPQEIARMSPDLLHASPVCTRFSCANKTPGEIALDVEAAQSVLRAVQKTRPPAISIENVPAYAKSESWQDILEPGLRRAGYNLDQGVYNAADLGGIQERSRFIARGVREGDLPPVPQSQPRRDWYQGVGDLIERAPQDRIPDWEMRRLRSMFERGSLDPDSPIITMGGSAGRSVAHARGAGGPAPTLKAANEVPRILLPGGEARRVTPEIMRRLMGLPDDYPLPQNYYEAKRILGQGMEGNMTRQLIDPLLRRQGPAKSNTSSLSALSEGWSGRGVQNQISEGNSYIRLHEVRVPESQRGSGIGTKFMDELVSYADQAGKPVLLTPSTDFGATSKSRLENFYRRFGFVPNRGRQKDYSLPNEAMIRRPQ